MPTKYWIVDQSFQILQAVIRFGKYLRGGFLGIANKAREFLQVCEETIKHVHGRLGTFLASPHCN